MLLVVTGKNQSSCLDNSINSSSMKFWLVVQRPIIPIVGDNLCASGSEALLR